MVNFPVFESASPWLGPQAWGVVVSLLGTFVALWFGVTNGQRAEKQFHTNTSLQMVGKLIDLIFACKFESKEGIEALKRVWFEGIGKKLNGEHSCEMWKTVEGNSSDKDIHKCVHDFYNGNLSIHANKIEGDLETLFYYYLDIFETCPKTLIGSLKKIHARELSFLCFVFCVIRNNQKAAQTIRDKRIFDRPINTLESLPKNSELIIQRIAEGKFN